MLDFNEELAKFQPCADLEEAEENIYGKELEEIEIFIFKSICHTC